MSTEDEGRVNDERPSSTTGTAPDSPSYLVGIGASAGGLEALEAFFKSAPADTGMAFVVVPHLSPDFRSYLPELLGRFTSMRVVALQESVTLKSNNVYVLGPGKELTVDGQLLVVHDRSADGKLHLPINRFFRSLATWGERAVAIVLSGTGSDGTLGIEAVHSAGGTVLAQTSESSGFDGMPRSAAETGLVDAALEPSEMGSALVAISSGKAGSLRDLVPEHVDERDPEYGDILRLLREFYDIDFNHYKPGTVIRRIERRLSIHRPGETLAGYARYLAGDHDELDHLFRDLLIGVTRFFRDPESFEALRVALISMIDGVEVGGDLRIWVCGCSTGEEAYSVAMLAHEAFEARRREPQVRVFATDMHAYSLQTAAVGIYSTESLEHVPDKLRYKHFIEQEPGHWKVNADLRKAVIFSRHNVIRDPSFTRMDLVTCRNLLIYLRAPAQAQALGSFHFALKPDGILFLGESETPGELETAFPAVDRRHKIYRKDRSFRPSIPLLRDRLPSLEGGGVVRAGEDGLALGRVYDLLLDRYMPGGLLLNERNDVVHVFGDGSRYLRPHAGRFRLNALAMLDPELRVAVSGALREAQQEARAVSYSGVRVPVDEREINVRVTVEPIHDKVVDRPYFLVLLHPEARVALPAAETPPSFSLDRTAVVQISALETELHHARQRLQSTVEQLETTNEELQSSNEELIASNEELQSTNEELHAVNEELHTVNGEYQQKIAELNAASSDLRNLIRSTGIATIFIDQERRVRLYTPAATKLFRLLPHDVGRDLFDFMPLVPDPALHEDVARNAAGDAVPERRLDGGDGVTLARRITPYRDGNDRMAGHVLTYVDVTAYARLESELREQEARFRNLIESVPQFVWASDAEGNVAYISPKWYAYTGHPAGSIPETGSLLYTHPDDRARVSEAFNLGREGGRGFTFEARIRRHDDVYRWFEVCGVPARDAEGRGAGWYATGTDIDDRKRAEAELVRHRHHLEELVNERTSALRVERDRAEGARAQVEALIAMAPEAILISSETGRLLRWNAAASTLFGYAPDVMATLTVEDLLPPARRVAHRKARADFLGGEEGGNERSMGRGRTFPARRADGAIFEAEVSLSRVMMDGEPCAIAVVRDQTEIILQKDRSEAANRAKSTFLANMSHEIRTPLNAIMGQAQILRVETPSEASRGRLDRIMSASQHLLSIIDDVLDLSKIEAGKLALEEIDFDLDDVVRKAEAMLSEPAQSKGLRLGSDVDPRLPRLLHGDPRRLSQVIINYGSNAVKFTASGHVMIRISMLEQSEESVLVRFVVEDTGEGIPWEQQGRLFQPFEQLDAATNRRHGGTGLGLSICRHLARLMQGEVGMESEPGRGSTFWFTARLGRVAAAGERAAPSVSAPPAPEAADSGARVLVADDDALGRELSRDMIRHLSGIEVDVVESGVEAVAYAKAGRYDLIFMDMQMPVMDGLTATRRIRELPGYAHTPIVGFTANAYADDRKRCLDAGMNDHLAKPVSMTALDAVLKRWMGERQG